MSHGTNPASALHESCYYMIRHKTAMSTLRMTLGIKLNDEGWYIHDVDDYLPSTPWYV